MVKVMNLPENRSKKCWLNFPVLVPSRSGNRDQRRHYKHWTRDPRTGDPRTRGPGTQGPGFLRAVLDCSSSNTTMQAISANATCLTHNYVLYVVAMHTEGVIYSRQRYSLTSLILRVVYCQFCKARLAHRHDTQSERVWRLFAFDL